MATVFEQGKYGKMVTSGWNGIPYDKHISGGHFWSFSSAPHDI